MNGSLFIRLTTIGVNSACDPIGKSDDDLSLVLDIDSELEARMTAEGLLLHNPAMEGILIGNATAFDANGDSTSVEMSYADGKLTLTVPGAWLESAAYPILIDPIVVRWTHTSDAQHSPSIAYDSDLNQLATAYVDANGSDAHIGIRIVNADSGATPIGYPTTTAISSGAGIIDDAPVVVYNADAASGPEFWVVYVRNRDYFLRRVDATTGLTIGTEIYLEKAQSNPGGHDFAVVSDSLHADKGEGLLIWSYKNGSSADYKTRGILVNNDGIPQGTEFNVYSTTGKDVKEPALAFDETAGSYIAVVRRGNAIYTRLVNTDGTIGGANNLGSGYHPDVAASSGQALVVWDYADDIYAQRLIGGATDGEVFFVTARVGTDEYPTLAADSGRIGWVVGWEDNTTATNSDLWMQLVTTTDGAALGGNLTAGNQVMINESDDEEHPALALRGDDSVMLAYEDWGAATANSTLELILNVNDLTVALSQYPVVTAYNDANDEGLIVYLNEGGANITLHARLLDVTTGNPVDVNNDPITLVGSGQNGSPAVIFVSVGASGGAEYLVFYERDNRIYLQRLDATDGYPVTGTSELEVASLGTDIQSINAAYDQTNGTLLLTWSDENVSGIHNVYGLLLDESGSKLNAWQPFEVQSTGSTIESVNDVTFDAILDTFAVVWVEDGDIKFRTVGRDKSLGVVTTLALGQNSNPSLAYNPEAGDGEILVVWEVGDSDNDLSGQRLANGTLQGSLITITGQLGHDANPEVVADIQRQGWIVIWQNEPGHTSESLWAVYVPGNASGDLTSTNAEVSGTYDIQSQEVAIIDGNDGQVYITYLDEASGGTSSPSSGRVTSATVTGIPAPALIPLPTLVVASDGGSYAVRVYPVKENNFQTIKAERFDVATGVVDALFGEVEVAQGSDSDTVLEIGDVVYNPGTTDLSVAPHYMVVYVIKGSNPSQFTGAYNGTIYLRRIALDGSFLETDPLYLGPARYAYGSLNIAVDTSDSASQGEALLVYSGDVNERGDYIVSEGLHLSVNGILIESFTILDTLPVWESQLNPDVTYDDDELDGRYIVALSVEDTVAGGYDLIVVPVSFTLAPYVKAAEATVVASNLYAHGAFEASITYDPTSDKSLLLWINASNSDLYGQHLLGATLSDEIFITASQLGGVVGFEAVPDTGNVDGGWLVTWQNSYTDDPMKGPDQDVWLTQVPFDAELSVVENNFPVSSSADASEQIPSVVPVPGSTQALIVYGEWDYVLSEDGTYYTTQFNSYQTVAEIAIPESTSSSIPSDHWTITTSETQYEPTITFDGSGQALVVYRTSDSGGAVTGLEARIINTSDGSMVVDGIFIASSDVATEASVIYHANNGSPEYWVAYAYIGPDCTSSDAGIPKIVRIDAVTGVINGTIGFGSDGGLLNGQAVQPSLSLDPSIGGKVLITYLAPVSGCSGLDVGYGQFFNADGSAAGSKFELDNTTSSITQARGAIAVFDIVSDTTIFADMYGNLFSFSASDPGGTMVALANQLGLSGISDHQLSYDPMSGLSLLVWVTAEGDIYGARLNANGVIEQPFLISDSTGDNHSPSIAYDPQDGGWVVIWGSTPTTTTTILAKRILTDITLIPAGNNPTPAIEQGLLMDEPDVAVDDLGVPSVVLQEKLANSDGWSVAYIRNLTVDADVPAGVQNRWHYDYDKLGRLTYACATWDGVACLSDEFTYAYDGAGNITEMSRWDATTESVQTVGFIVNDANQIVCQDTTLDGVCNITFTYDAYGNLTFDGALNYTYDSANRLATVSDGISTTTYRYNGDGERVGMDTDDGTTTSTTDYLLDVAMPLTTILSETTDGVTTIYLHGLGPVAQKKDTDTTYFLGDALGSVRQVTDESGSVQMARTFDPYGNPYGESAASPTQLGYTGEPTDDKGLVYLRARTYNPSIGGFTQRDSYPGSMGSPASMNPYLYAHGSPTRYTDPSGMFICAGVCTFLAVSAVLIIGAAIIGGVAGGVVGGGVELGSQLLSGTSLDDVNWGRVKAYAFEGAVVGAITAAAVMTVAIASTVFAPAAASVAIAGTKITVGAAGALFLDITIGVAWDMSVHGDPFGRAAVVNVVAGSFGEVGGEAIGKAGRYVSRNVDLDPVVHAIARRFDTGSVHLQHVDYPDSIRQFRETINYNPKRNKKGKLKGNVGRGRYVNGNFTHEMYSTSASPKKNGDNRYPGTAPLLPKDKQRYRTLMHSEAYPNKKWNNDFDRATDSEARLLEYYANLFDPARSQGPKRNVFGTLTLYTERFPCSSCGGFYHMGTGGVIGQFHQEFPNINIIIQYSEIP